MKRAGWCAGAMHEPTGDLSGWSIPTRWSSCARRAVRPSLGRGARLGTASACRPGRLDGSLQSALCVTSVARSVDLDAPAPSGRRWTIARRPCYRQHGERGDAESTPEDPCPDAHVDVALSEGVLVAQSGTTFVVWLRQVAQLMFPTNTEAANQMESMYIDGCGRATDQPRDLLRRAPPRSRHAEDEQQAPLL